MAGVLASVDSRTQLVGENRLELLMFRLLTGQLFAINVFKIQEVMRLPALSNLPHHHPYVVGVTHLRGQTVTVINLSQAIGMPALKPTENSNLIVTEYNNSIQAFLVGGVDRIINMNWDQIMPPPRTTGRSHYLTAITRVDDQIVEIIDVEKVLAEISPYTITLDTESMDDRILNAAKDMEILMVDDSSTARSQVKETLSQLGITIHESRDGREGLDKLKAWADAGEDVPRKLLMLITDAEMPEMDGYRLTREIREDPRLKDLFIVLHTSLSGSFNKAMVQKVGCDDFLSKFQPKQLFEVVSRRIADVQGIE
ncbi:two-component system, chemotaxis family, response regulator CheV [Oceanospirillum multiglobuliferum]|uniref:Chemotaxis protein CheW n=3 Tax=Oceanospirillum TaxID=965 RepID=A0A1T4MPI2_9GAMM|nr:chemotaxis protein CheV [Oceanospirillum multiglobuliferum]OPX56939.1 chemotaxis protein CheW [Oceanospirillum multiglobuliferum]SJZ68863.1 two-component system, chemotaxis family, response regulator CheV [Oceanospirillum multiglobuliferum]